MQILRAEKIPVSVEAVEVKLEDYPNIASWCHGTITEYLDTPNGYPYAVIEYRTIQGMNSCRVGDYLIKENEVFYTVSDERYKYMFRELT